jgi:hypothetical protein
MKHIFIKFYSGAFWLLLALVVACRSGNGDDQEKIHKTKSIDFAEFHINDITPAAQEDLRRWKDFQVLMQVVTSMAPTKIKQPAPMVATNPDSLVVCNRLYPMNSKTVKEAAKVDIEYRTVEGVKDTIFRFEKERDSKFCFLQWDTFLVAQIPYTFSVVMKKNSYPKVNLEFLQGDTPVTTAVLALDTLTTSSANVKRTALTDDWFGYEVTFSPKKSEAYSIRLSFDPEVKMNDNVIFYRSVLKIPARDFSKLGAYSDKIVAQHTDVESSYYSVFFWLRQIEDALHQLLLEDAFPERMNVPAVRARFRLLDTQIKALADNVRNNPDFKEEELKRDIRILEGTFNSIISRINNIYNSDLDDRMRFLGTQNIDSLIVP